MPARRPRAQRADDDGSDEDVVPQQKRRGRRPPTDEEIEEDEEEEELDSEEMDADQVPAPELSAHGLLAKKLVRYALACEYSRTVIRREGIKEKVLGNQGRAFKKVFAIAQIQLREVFGMELQELPVKEKVTVQERRQALKANAPPKSGSGAYILISILDPKYRTGSILPPSKTPRPDQEASYAGFYTFIIALIMLSGGELSEQKLRRQLARTNADRNVAGEKTDDVLQRMQRQGYIVRRAERAADGGEEAVSWLVGPRGKVEVGADGVAGLVREVYGGAAAELDRRIEVSLGTKVRAAAEAEAEEVEGDTREGEASGVPAENARGSRRSGRLSR